MMHALWLAKSYIWPQRMPCFCIYSLWPWLPILWSCSNEEANYTRSGRCWYLKMVLWSPLARLSCPFREWSIWQRIINLIFATNSSTRAPLGIFLADTIRWWVPRTVKIPLCAMAFVAVVFRVKLPAIWRDYWKTKLGGIIFSSTMKLLLVMVSLIIGQGQSNNHSWTSPIATVSLTLFPVFGPLFLFVEFLHLPNNHLFHRDCSW